MSDFFILDENHNVIPAANTLEWGEFFNKPDRIVAATEIGEIRVSTVFLGIDHSWGGDKPVVFETMIFGGEHDQYQDRCCTWVEAEAMHVKAVAIAKGELAP